MFSSTHYLLLCVAANIVTCSANVISANEVIEDKELVLAFVVNRHGERTPDSDELSLSDQKAKLGNISALVGLEGLTNDGKRRAYQLGKFFRQRYGTQGLGLVSNLYRHDEIAVRSTDKDRTKMTALVAMAAMYPPELEQQWDEAVGKVWQPVPYSAEPLTEDCLRYYSNCAKFKSLLAKAKEEAVKEEFASYKDLAVKIKQQTGRNFSENPLMFQTLFDLFKSQVGLGLDVPEWAKPQLPRLSEAARLAYKLYYKNDAMKRIGGGVLLDQFLKAASDLAAGKPVSKRLRIFSAHDFNLGAFMAVSGVTKESIPEYGSAYALELYKSSRNPEQFYVQAIYLPQAGESIPHNLKISECGFNCDLNKFIELSKPYRLPLEEYNMVCNISLS